MQNYLKLLRFLHAHQRLFLLAVAAMFAASTLEGIQLPMLVPLIDRSFTNKPIVPPNQLPGFLSAIVDHFNAIESEKVFWILVISIIPLLLVKHAFTYCYQLLMNDVAQRVMRDVRYRLYEKIQNLSLDYFGQKRTGELISRITNDVQIIENAVSYGVTDLFRQIFLIVIYVGIAFSIHFWAALVVFLVFPFLAWPIGQIGRKLKKIARSSQERMADISSILLETISGVRVVKAFCTEKYEINRFREKNQEFYKLKMKAVRRNLLLGPITEIFGAACGVLIILWLGKQVMGGRLSFGIFILFFASIMSIISPVKKLGNVNALTQQALSANERIYDVLDKEPTVKEKPDAREIPAIQKSILFENVNFAYEKENGFVVQGIRLEVKVGELVAIVGPTGSGKSTLASLIPRFYDPSQGAIKIDGIDLRDVTFPSLRRQIGIVAQETFLFNDTVRANIAYGVERPDQRAIEVAAERAYAHQFIADMPGGYDTVIGDRGFRLSGGERQRIAIARAIMRNPAILILDEATSQLDSQSEKYVHQALDELMQGRTVIAIAHRLSTIKKANKIIVLESGVVVGEGKHEDLLRTCTLYRRLYETQFQV